MCDIIAVTAVGYILAVSILSAAVTVYDKRASMISGRRRVPEKTLMGVAVFGGSVAMYLTMLVIRHKTKHPGFMVGIPFIIILQYGVFFLMYNAVK